METLDEKTVSCPYCNAEVYAWYLVFYSDKCPRCEQKMIGEEKRERLCSGLQDSHFC